MGDSSNTTSELVAFGSQMRKEFLFDPSYRNLNHGSFGTYPRAVRYALRRYQERVESAPDPFIFNIYPKELDKSRMALATYLNVSVDEIVIVPNATTAVNTVLRNLKFEQGDIIVQLDTIYAACGKTIEYICETTPATTQRVDFHYPIEDEELVQKFKDVIKKANRTGNVRVAVFDIVASQPGVRMPFERLTDVCREEDVLSLIDGAHGIGHVHLDLGRLQPDFFVSNCHKWLYVPRGCAVFHVPIRNQALMRSSLPTSHGFIPMPADGDKISNPFHVDPCKSQFATQFEFVGTIDNSNYLCIPDALKFRQEVCGGEDKIISYCTKLAKEGGARVAEILGTEVMDNKTHTLTNCCMTNIRLPIDVPVSDPDPPELQPSEVIPKWMSDIMINEYNTHIMIRWYAGKFWARFSGQTYLEIADFEWGAEALKSICARVEKGEWKGPAKKKELPVRTKE